MLTLVLVAVLAAPATAGQVTDQLGRPLTVPENPRRVVALAPSIAEIIFALGEEARLAGVTQYTDFPPQAALLPQVGSYVQPDLERIVRLGPDLCIAIKDGNPKETVERLAALHIPVYAVDPRNLDAMVETVVDIGRLLNAGQRAEALAAGLRERISRVKEKTARVAERPRVFFQIGTDPIVAVGTNTFAHELIVLAGGDNLTAGANAYPLFSREQVLALAPEIIIITSMTRDEAFDRVKGEWTRWPSLPAVQSQRIFLVDSNLFDRPSPRLVDALETLARLVQPQLFKETP